MAGPCLIRPLLPSDLPEVSRLEEASFSDAWTPAMLEEAFVARGAVALAACNPEGGMVGYLLGRVVADEGEILSVAVDPSARRGGIGRHLLAQALVALEAGGADTVWLEVRDSNLAARLMYPDSGFVVAGVRRDYYDRPVEDALILRRHLGA